jgi:hypothetical protein
LLALPLLPTTHSFYVPSYLNLTRFDEDFLEDGDDDDAVGDYDAANDDIDLEVDSEGDVVIDSDDDGGGAGIGSTQVDATQPENTHALISAMQDDNDGGGGGGDKAERKRKKSELGCK